MKKALILGALAAGAAAAAVAIVKSKKKNSCYCDCDYDEMDENYDDCCCGCECDCEDDECYDCEIPAEKAEDAGVITADACVCDEDIDFDKETGAVCAGNCSEEEVLDKVEDKVESDEV